MRPPQWASPDRLRRWDAFLRRRPVDRPLLGCSVGYYMHEAFPKLCASLPRGRVEPEDILLDAFLEDCEGLLRLHSEIGDDYPFVGVPFLYLPWMEAIMGCPVRAAESAMSAEPLVGEWEDHAPRCRGSTR
jgi:hypothetical protein